MREFAIEKVLEYIDEHIEDKLLLNDIAKNIGYSPFYVSRMFSQIMGISIVSYVRMRKLQFAFSSLQNSKTILEVAYQYGFESHEGFSRSFKRFFGFSPRVIKGQQGTYAIPSYCVMKERRIEMLNGKNNIEDMHFMLFALLKEALIEMEEGYCSNIKISILSHNYIEIMDNGRGIPLVEEVQKSNEILQHIFGGQPMFSLNYTNIEDFNNLELNMVNSLCENMSICVWRNGKSYSQEYVNGVAQHELYVENTSHPSGMKITLKPNSTIFENVLWSKKMIDDYIIQNASNYLKDICVEEINS